MISSVPGVLGVRFMASNSLLILSAGVMAGVEGAVVLVVVRIWLSLSSP